MGRNGAVMKHLSATIGAMMEQSPMLHAKWGAMPKVTGAVMQLSSATAAALAGVATVGDGAPG